MRLISLLNTVTPEIWINKVGTGLYQIEVNGKSVNTNDSLLYDDLMTYADYDGDIPAGEHTHYKDPIRAAVQLVRQNNPAQGHNMGQVTLSTKAGR